MPQTITATSGEILEVEEVKRYLRIPDNINDEDEEINGMIAAARIEAERITHRTLRPSVTRVENRTRWFNRFVFQHPPLHTTPVITVKYYDTSNTLTTIDASNYTKVPKVSTGDENEGVSWIDFDTFFVFPILYDRRTDRIEITYTTGYAAAVTNTVNVARQAIKMLVWDIYYGETGTTTSSMTNTILAKRLLGTIAFGFYA